MFTRGYPHPTTSSTRAWHRSPAPGVASSPAAPWSAAYRHAPPPRPSSGTKVWPGGEEVGWCLGTQLIKVGDDHQKLWFDNTQKSGVHHQFFWDLAKENMYLTINNVDFVKKQLYLNKKNDINQETCGFKHQKVCTVTTKSRDWTKRKK